MLPVRLARAEGAVEFSSGMLTFSRPSGVAPLAHPHAGSAPERGRPGSRYTMPSTGRPTEAPKISPGKITTASDHVAPVHRSLPPSMRSTVPSVTKLIVSYKSPPLDLRTFPTSHRQDKKEVEDITSFMEGRSFSMWKDTDLEAGAELEKQISGAISTALSKGGYTVAFISKASIQSKFMMAELEFLDEKYARDGSSASRLVRCVQCSVPRVSACNELAKVNRSGFVAKMLWGIPTCQVHKHVLENVN